MIYITVRLKINAQQEKSQQSFYLTDVIRTFVGLPLCSPLK